jgi:hypothetical protein
MPEHLYGTLSRMNHRRAMRLYRAQGAIWLWLGFASLLSFIAWVADPEAAAKRSAIGRQLQSPFDLCWNTLWALGGVAIIYGIWFYRPRAEIIGHIFVTAAIVTYSVAIVYALGVTPTAFITCGIAIASAFRAYFLWSVTPKKGQDDVELMDVV